MTYTSQNFHYSPSSRGLGVPGVVSVAFPYISGGGTPLFGFDPWSLAISGAIMGITTLIGRFKKRNAQKEASTSIVNEAAPILEDNLRAWNQSSKTIPEQELALANFDNVWAVVFQQCSNPKLGSAGERCISERGRNATTNYNWYKLFRDPIANDPNVRPETLAEQTLPSDFVDAQGNPLFDLRQVGLAAGIIIAAIVVPRFL